VYERQERGGKRENRDTTCRPVLVLRVQ
jgi:hypothetical protein